MARTPHMRYVRHRNFNRLRHSTHFKAFLEEQADRLETTAEDVFNLMKNAGYTAEEIANLSAVPAAPENTALPSISGTPTVGQELSAANGTWTGSPAPGYEYQWNRDDAPIAGATASDYTLVADDEGTLITVTVTASNSQGSASATSEAVGPVAAAPVAPAFTANPVLSGTPTVGQQLTVTNGTATGTPAPTFTRSWLRDGVAISPAQTGTTYTLVEDDVDASITVEVTATNSAGTDTATSNALGPVAAA